MFPDTLTPTQAIDEKAKATACSSSRSCVTSYPVREQYGLIWVWPSAGPAAQAEAAAAALPLSRGVLKAAEAGQYLRWYRRELEYSWDILIENLTDPCKYRLG
jgi:phenylpropionate dioxygenase-like ring-hydroxylating dioxygenase large terminal subunit